MDPNIKINFLIDNCQVIIVFCLVFAGFVWDAWKSAKKRQKEKKEINVLKKLVDSTKDKSVSLS